MHTADNYDELCYLCANTCFHSFLAQPNGRIIKLTECN